MSVPVRIRNWYTRRPKLASPYLAPEVVGIAVAGEVHGHPRKPDGMRVTTTRVVRTEGRRFWTASGTEYVFEGEPSPKFLESVKSQGRAYDSAEPLKVTR